jgi:RNA-binding protein
MPLDSKQRKQLKAAAHHLNPTVRIGQHGLTEGVVGETDHSLELHELIKVHVQHGDRHERAAIIAKLAEATRSELVSTIGKVGILYRQKEKNND